MRSSHIRDVDNSGVGSDGAFGVSQARLVVTGDVYAAESPLNMNDGQADLLGTDFDGSESDLCEPSTTHDSGHGKRIYRNLVG